MQSLIARAGRPRPADVIAGLSVAFVLIPQSLANAEIAGVPVYVGLYAAALPSLVAAFFVSSPYLQTGPVALTALLTFGALQGLGAEPGTTEYVALAALLALVVGVVRTLIGAFRGGFLAYFMSQPVLIGFTSAAAILILSSQVPTAVGVVAPDGQILEKAWWALIHISEWEPAAVGLSLVTAVLVLGGRKLHRVFPGVLVAVILGIVYSVVTDYDGLIVGDVPAGLPPFSLDLPWGSLPSLLVSGVVIALVGFAEAAAISRTFAAQERQTWSPDREFVSQGVANLASGISGGFPVGGSFARSSVARLAGGKTRWVGAISGLVVLAFLPVAGVLSPLPRAILGAIVISAVAQLIRLSPLWTMWKHSKPQTAVLWTTFSLTLILSPRVEFAVITGIGLGILIHVWREIKVGVGSSFDGQTLRLTPRGVLFFGSAPPLNEALLQLLAEHQDASALVFDLGSLGRIDYTGALVLKSVAEQAEGAGLEVSFEKVPPQTRRILGGILEQKLPEIGEP
ncbi:MAG: SulP family inorganic anion transporter [Acidimicrobiia bacterium]|nr:SulP family inorganic anion transporter [Acidimicrobiia bacterium]